jgi:hypothetical protein
LLQSCGIPVIRKHIDFVLATGVVDKGELDRFAVSDGPAEIAFVLRIVLFPGRELLSRIGCLRFLVVGGISTR